MPEQDLALIRFVTARYRELQGLRTVLDGVILLSVWGILLWAPPDRHPRIFFLAVLLWTTLSMWGGARVRRYYAHRLGRAMPAGGDRYDESIFALAHAPYQILLASTAISLGGGFVLLLPALTARKAWELWRDWPYRAHWVLPVAVGTGFTLAFFQLGSAAQFRMWQWMLMVSGSVSLMIAGALDHGLLVRVMRGAAGATSRAEHATTSGSGL